MLEKILGCSASTRAGPFTSSRLQCRNAPSTATLLPTMAHIIERASLASSCNVQASLVSADLGTPPPRTDSLQESSRLQCRKAPSTATLLPTMAHIIERASLASSCAARDAFDMCSVNG